MSVVPFTVVLVKLVTFSLWPYFTEYVSGVYVTIGTSQEIVTPTGLASITESSIGKDGGDESRKEDKYRR